MGSVKPLPLLLIQILAILLFIIWLIKVGAEGKKPFPDVKSYIPFLLFLFICLFQTVPLPNSLLGILSEKSLEIWNATDSVITAIGAEGMGNFHTISLYPNITLRKSLLLITYLMFGIVVARSYRSKRGIKLLLIPVFVILFFESAVGIYQYLSSGGEIDARGTFVNRNHFAGFLEMCFPLALGYAFSLGDWKENRQKPFIKRLISSENVQKQTLLLFLLGIVFLAIVLSKSRMGIFSAAVSLLFFYFLASRFLRKGLELKWMIYAVVAVAMFFGMYIGLYPLIERYMLIGENLPARTLLWRDMYNLIKDFPVFGTGLGTFGYVYPLYKQLVEEPIVFLYSHNDYLQVIAETGVLGFTVLMTALFLFVYNSVKALIDVSQVHDHFSFFISLGALTGIFSILVHSFVDFNLQIPSNALDFAFLFGLSVAAVKREKLENPRERMRMDTDPMMQGTRMNRRGREHTSKVDEECIHLH